MLRSNPTRDFLTAIVLLLAVGVCGIITLQVLFSRTYAFRAQARVGQSIVRAIEDFRTRTGTYPISLAELVPKYLQTTPDIQPEGQLKSGSWEYHTVTNGTVVSFTLRSYMGRGEVEYDPPNWIGNDEGQKTVVLKDK